MVDRMTDFLFDTFKKTVEEKIDDAQSQEEVDEIIKKVEQIDLAEISSEMYSIIANDTVDYMKETMYQEVMISRAQDQEFVIIQEQKWNKAFVSSEAFYMLVMDVTQTYVKYVNSLPQEDREKYCHIFTALQHIHGRAMQQFLEVITLMKNGFADGAYARWRSMYELMIISSFIIKYGEPVAESFIESSETTDRYEWARKSGIFSSKKRYISFNDIQKNCGVESSIWQKQYDLANKIIHASPQGTFARLGNMGNKEVIPVGRSDYGITTPGEHSAISLAQITTMFLTIHPSGDGLVAVGTIEKWVDVIRENYFRTHDLIFPEDEKLWDESIGDEDDSPEE